MAPKVRDLSLLSLLLIATSFYLTWGECVNATTSCKVNAKLVTQNNCSKCVCLVGFYHHGGLLSCQRCRSCKFPFVIIQNCTQTSDTECGLCQKTHFHTKKGCKKCRECENGIIKKCGRNHDAICSLATTSSSMKLTTLATGSHEDRNEKVECKRSDIWFTLFVMQSAVIAVSLIVLCVLCRRCSRNNYTNVIDESSLAASSSTISSLMLNTKCKSAHDINILTKEEKGTLIRVLPGGYVDQLALLLDQNITPNWVQLAYAFKYTLQGVAFIKGRNNQFTQQLLLELGTKNSSTVESLWRSLKLIQRDDACDAFIKFILSLREDNESAIMFME